MKSKWLDSITRLFEHRAVVLMYHRIADVPVDPWQLAVSPLNFEQQIQRLTEKFQVLSVPELLQNLQQKKLAANSVCITFDDGYADNFLCAMPILERYNCPATFFITSHFTGQRQPFWWDTLQMLLLAAPQLPQLFQIPIQEETFDFDLGDEAVLTEEMLKKHQSWQWPDTPPTRRCALYLKIWEQLKPLQNTEIITTLEALKSKVDYNPAISEAMLPMDHVHLSRLSQNKLFDIGLHTATHPALAYHPEDVQYNELVENKNALQPYQPVNAVAFPYGNYNNTTLSVLDKQRIDAGFTTEEQKLTAKSKRHCLGRFQVKNQNGIDFENQLRHWLKA